MAEISDIINTYASINAKIGDFKLHLDYDSNVYNCLSSSTGKMSLEKFKEPFFRLMPGLENAVKNVDKLKLSASYFDYIAFHPSIFARTILENKRICTDILISNYLFKESQKANWLVEPTSSKSFSLPIGEIIPWSSYKKSPPDPIFNPSLGPNIKEGTIGNFVTVFVKLDEIDTVLSKLKNTVVTWYGNLTGGWKLVVGATASVGGLGSYIGTLYFLDHRKYYGVADKVLSFGVENLVKEAPPFIGKPLKPLSISIKMEGLSVKIDSLNLKAFGPGEKRIEVTFGIAIGK